MQVSYVTTGSHPRRGSIVPAIAISLLLIMGGIALVLDRIWIDAAQVELLAAAEAAALAGARQLADDDLLRTAPSTQRRLDAVRTVAANIAAQNLVAGQPLQLQAESDVKIGRIAVSAATGQAMFLETSRHPNTVVVFARQLRSRGNPVALLMRQVTQQPAADLAVSAEAGLDDRIVGVRPAEGFAVPALPLAILATDPAGKRKDTWQEQIVKRSGRDEFGYDASRGQVTAGPDGIPEITLRSEDRSDRSSPPNLKLVDLGTDLRDAGLVEQILQGWSATDLERFGGEVLLSQQVPSGESAPPTANAGDGAAQTLPPFPKGGPEGGPQQALSLGATSWLGQPTLGALRSVQGECRICLLYVDEPAAAGRPVGTRVQCVALVAGRIMDVVCESRAAPQLVFQPGIIVTRAAVVAAGAGPAVGADPSNLLSAPHYIYKLGLTQ